MTRFLLAACLAAAVLTAGPGASAQQLDSREAIQLRDQILELRAEIQQMHDQGGNGGSALAPAAAPASPAQPLPQGDIVAKLLDRVQRLEDTVRVLSGRIDEANNARQRDHDELAKQIGDLSFRLDNAGGAGGTAAGAGAGAAAAAAGLPTPIAPAAPPPTSDFGAATPPQAAPPLAPLPVPPAPPKRTAESILKEGYAALARKDYAAAQASAQDVLASAKGGRAIDAQFLLAQSLYGARDYTSAAVAFDDTYGKSRTGPHAQDSLIGLANALTALEQRKAACETLDKLRAEFPTLRSADLLTQAANARKAAGCR